MVKRAFQRLCAAWTALFATATLALASPPAGPCTLPPGAADYETRTVALPGGAELTLAWLGACTMRLGKGGGVAASDPIEMSLDGFWIGVCEVTQAQWESVMGTNPSYFRGEELAGASLRGKLPVECVSWEDCAEFCRRTGLRLPTEMEWLRARQSSWLQAAPGWTAQNSGKRTHPVGQSPSGAVGTISDMNGNVCEWCADWFGPWPEGGAAANYAGPADGTERVVCDGCWCGDEWFDARRRVERLSLPPACRYNNVGFRVCLTPVPGE